MLKTQLPLYKIYFYLIFMILGGSLFASTTLFLKRHISYDTIQAGKEIKEEGKMALKSKVFRVPPPVSSVDKDLVFMQTCFQDTTTFFAVSGEDVDSVRWYFGTGNPADTSSKLNPTFIYQAGGTYQVTVRYFKDGDSIDVVKTVNISSESLTPQGLVQDTICPKETTNIGPSVAGDSYLWSTGETTATIPVDSAGNFWVAVTKGTCTRVYKYEVTVYGQGRNRAAIWHFGNQAGLDFNQQPPVPKPGAMNTGEGTATLSDIDGKLLFYTSGSTIYNKDHEVMDNGTSIGGDTTSTQSSIIIPWPNHEPNYFVFTTQQINSVGNNLMYSLVDMKGDGGDGSVIFKDNFLYSPTTERLTAYGSDSVYWLITHDYNNNTFTVFKIDSSGVNLPPQTFSLGSSHTSAAEGQGTIKISTTGEFIAVAFGSSVELYKFNDTTGVISPTGNLTSPIKLDVADANAAAYGIEFSPDGSKLYVSQQSPGKLFQYNLTDTSGAVLPIDTIVKYKYQVATGGTFGALQIGPDDKIYLAVEGAGSLGVINSPDEEGAEVDFILAGQDLGGKTSHLGLPNFVQSFIEPPPGPGIVYLDTCFPGPVMFQGSGYGDRDNFTWNFGDGSPTQSGSVNMMSQVTHAYPRPGTYQVSLSITNDCQLDTIVFETITIVASPNPISLGNDRTLDCTGAGITLDAGPVRAGESYLWSTGATARTIIVTTPGTYSVMVINQQGCAQMDEVNVNTGSPPVNLGPDRTICQGDTAQINPGNPGATRVWSKDGVTLPTTSRILTVRESGLYSVVITDPLTQCTGTDDILVTVNPHPDVTMTSTPPTACGMANDGEITVSFPGIDLPATSTVTITNPAGVTTPAPAPNTPTTIQFPALTQGFYRINITNAQGCDTLLAVALNPPGAPVYTPPAPITCTVSTTDATFTGVPLNSTVNIFDQETGTTTGAAGNGTSPNLSVPLSEGTFTITIINAGCTYTYPNVFVAPPVDRPDVEDLGPDFSICGTTLISTSYNSAYVYNWTKPDGTTPGQGQNPAEIIADQPGLYTLSVVNGTCTVTDEINLIPSTFNVKLGGDSVKCENGIAAILVPDFSANPPGDDVTKYSYQWMRNGIVIPDISPTLSVMEAAGTVQYSVRVRNPFSGCEASDIIPVTTNPSPQDNLGGSVNACGGSSVDLDAGNPGGTYAWTGPVGGIPAGQEANQIVSVTEPGYYSVTVDVGGCSEVFGVQVAFDAGPDLSLSQDTLRYCGDRQKSVTLRASTVPQVNTTYLWRYQDYQGGAETTVGTTNQIIASNPGMYIVEVTGENCTVVDTANVKNECETLIFVPDAFTPGRGTTNGVLQIFGPPVRKFEMTIFNRWGEIVFHTANRDVPWNGRFLNKGKDAPLGTYVYLITYYSERGDPNRKITQRGSIVLIR